MMIMTHTKNRTVWNFLCDLWKQWKFNFPLDFYYFVFQFLWFVFFSFIPNSPQMCHQHNSIHCFCFIFFIQTLNFVELLLWGAAAGRGNIHFLIKHLYVIVCHRDESEWESDFFALEKYKNHVASTISVTKDCKKHKT